MASTTVKSISSDYDDNQDYDRLEEAKRFDDSKLGVKGLIDSGLTSIPRIFIHPSDALANLKPVLRPRSEVIPTIDLSGFNSDRRPAIVEKLSRASRELGFFQIVNHGVPVEVMDRAISGIKAFHEQPSEIKKQWYRRDGGTGVSFISNIDLFRAKAASWRDTLQVMLGPSLPELEKIPEICRNEVIEWNKQATNVAEMLMELLSEGLGLDAGRLKKMSCLEGKTMVAHYYPHCPQPDLTFGITSHTDPGVLTVLLQDHIGGLQVKHGDEWIDVKPVPGALVINIGDIFQILSNDEYKSVDHRVLANPSPDPRVSIAVFFNPSKRDCLYGPIPELISPEKPALYRQFTLTDYMRRFFSKDLEDKTLTNFYRL
ncbi:hypothetical protein JCGZ_04750 [Jatropha curcas]|uniref:Fe2OG dioxygenase domain-containing protein n=1 Tax=Jatropha curcas TaxID=180498 RepID=A0A067KPN4_JATCU|nr:1-aminocyclopropane-1-carboxylate oxidase homolog 4 [Jatropha curcas]KDP38107.1 hypothetical protein JCGZ_04750 [Jatropha curcas]